MPSVQNVDLGSSLNITCEASGFPHPNITWEYASGYKHRVMILNTIKANRLNELNIDHSIFRGKEYEVHVVQVINFINLYNFIFREHS